MSDPTYMFKSNPLDFHPIPQVSEEDVRKAYQRAMDSMARLNRTASRHEGLSLIRRGVYDVDLDILNCF